MTAPIAGASKGSFGVPLLISLVSVVLTLALIEVGYRLIGRAAVAGHPWSDRPTHFYLPAGYPDRPQTGQPLPKAPGTYRILVLGDSFTYAQGNQFDDSFSARLERILNLNHQPERVEVFNWGVRGYSTAQEAELLKKGLPNLQPDLVILQITLNDPELEPYRVTHPWLDAHGRVNLTSPIFEYWTSLKFVVSRILNAQTHKDYIKYYFDLFEGEETWGRFSSALRTVQSLTNERGVKLLAVVFPLFSHPLTREYPFEPLHTKLDGFLKSQQISYLDLLRTYRGIPPERLQVEPGYDSHPNEIAQRLAADAIYRVLARREMVPPSSLVQNIESSR